MGRKNIWNTNSVAIPAQSWDVAEQTAGTPASAPKSVVEQLRVAAEKQRDRNWEKRAGNRPASFRGVPPTLQADVKQVALDLRVTVDDVARAFLEFSWQCYSKDELAITPTLTPQRLTLFPETAGWSTQHSGWRENAWHTPEAKTAASGKRPTKKDKPEAKAWQWPKANYRRLPAELLAAIRQLHEQYSVPVGEIVTLFLGHALEAYRSGRLILSPQPKVEAGLTFTRK